MKKQRNRKLAFGGIIALIIAVVILNPSLDDFDILGSNVNDVSTNSFNQISETFTGLLTVPSTLSTVATHLDCTYLQLMYEKENGIWQQVVSGHQDFIPTANEIVDRSTLKTITDFRYDLQLKCDWPAWVEQQSGDGLSLKSGSYSVFVGTGDFTTADTFFTKLTNSIPAKTLVNGQYTTVRSVQFTADSVENQLVQNSIGNAWLHVRLAPLFHITQTTFGIDTNVGTSSDQVTNVVTSRLINVLASSDIPDDTVPQINTNFMEIKKITRTIDDTIIYDGLRKTVLGSINPDASHGRQVEIHAELRNYHVNEPLPYVKILGDTVVLRFAGMIEDNAQFIGYYTVPSGTSDQVSIVTLKIDTRPDVPSTGKLSIVTPIVDDTTDIPPITGTNAIVCSDGRTVSSEDQCGTTPSGKIAEVQLQYQLFFKDGTDTKGNISTISAFEKALNELSVTSNADGSDKGKQIVSVQLEPFVSLKGEDDMQGWKITSTNMKFDIGYTIGSERTSVAVESLPVNFNTVTGTSATDVLSLGKGSVSFISNIDNKIALTENAKSLSDGQTLPFTLDIIAQGTFNMQDETLTSYQAITDGAKFTYNAVYSKASLGGGSGGTDDLVCNTLTQFRSNEEQGNASTPEVCRNLTSNNIEDPLFCEAPNLQTTREGYSKCVNEDDIIVDPKEKCQTGESIVDGICQLFGEEDPEECRDGTNWSEVEADCIAPPTGEPFGERTSNTDLERNICGVHQLWIDSTNDAYSCFDISAGGLGIHGGNACQDEQASLVITPSNEFACKILNGSSGGSSGGGTGSGGGGAGGNSGAGVVCEGVQCAYAFEEILEKLIDANKKQADDSMLIIAIIILAIVIVIGIILYKRNRY